MRRLVAFVFFVGVTSLSGCGTTLRTMCKQSCYREQDRCRGTSQNTGITCDQDLTVCLTRC